ncbi:MAG TPA: glycosyltransferase family 2 protein [Chthoniobacterales bacterium]|jgi:dolichol-phosphate mannosyltransferase|nr:glycosyltransferase family 2 protein [Chthoniobacterales bacterium]
MKPVYSLIVPVYNEEQSLQETYRRLATVMDTLAGESELILIDDGSRDGSLQLMRQLHESDPRVRYASLARNFGHQIAVTAGLSFARGEAVVILDADLQDPPELIPKLIAKWREGYEVVYARRISRQKESLTKKMFAYVFYRVLRLLTNEDIPADTGDFCLMDRKVVDILNALPERGRYLRGLRAWVGFRQAAVSFERESRFAGEVKYTFRKSLSLAVTGIVSFSRVPLRLATYLGFVVAAFALIMVGLVIYWRIFHPTAPLIGYTIITAAIFFLAAVQLLCLGIVGEYLGRVYDEVKGRPIFTIKEIAGIAGADSTSRHTADGAAIASRI